MSPIDTEGEWTHNIFAVELRPCPFVWRSQGTAASRTGADDFKERLSTSAHREIGQHISEFHH
jgi:hypothetical protein